METLPVDNQLLLSALKSGDFQTALPLLSKEDPPITIGPEGFTPLHYACRHGHTEVTRLLITQYRYSIESCSKHGQTPAHLAAEYGNVDALKVVMESLKTSMNAAGSHAVKTSPDTCNGALESNTRPESTTVQSRLLTISQCTPSWQNRIGQTPLHLAATNGHLNIVKYLVDDVGCPMSPTDEHGRSPLYLAAGSGQLEVVRYFTQEKNCDSNIGTTKRWKTCAINFAPGRTPLHAASRKGHVDIARFLVGSVKCNPSCKDDDGVTPILLAAANGYLLIVELLVESGCDPMVREEDGRTPIHYACQSGHLDTVKYFASTDQVELTCQDKNGVTPLGLAAEFGHLPIVHFLVESGCDPMVREDGGRTPVHYASQNGHNDIVKYFASTDQVDRSCRDRNGVTPLSLAAECGHLPVVQFFVESGCDPMVREEDGRTPVHYASQNGHLGTVKYLASTDQVELSCQDKNGVTPLSLAAECGHPPVVQFLVESGCDPMVRGEDGRTALHYSSQNGHLDIVKYIGDPCATDLSCQDNDGVTPVLLAAAKGHLPVVQYLVASGCNPQVTEVNGRTPVHQASQNGYVDTVKFLARTDQVDVSCKDKSGITSILLAAANGCLSVVQFLVESGCDPMVRDVNHKTPLHYASQNGHLDTVKYFSTIKTIELSCQDRTGITPLSLAARRGNITVVQFLVESGCDLMIREKNGRTPLHHASQKGHLDTVKYLASRDVDLSCQDKNGVTSVQLAMRYNHWDVVLYLHSEGEPIPSHISEALRPLSPRTKVFVVGNPASGKSTLVKALRAEGAWFGSFRNVGSVTPETAGIHPTEFDSKQYGKVTFYDFAGHPEYDSGHAVVFESASHPVIVVVVDWSKDHPTITRALRCWRLVLHTLIFAAGSQALVIVVGSHPDMVSPFQLSSKAALLEQFASSRVMSVVGQCVLDCRKPASSGMSDFHTLLKKSCKAVRVQSDFDYENGTILNQFLTSALPNLIACTFDELLTKVLGSEVSALHPLKSPDLLYQTCKSLNTSGHLLFLKNSTNCKDSWVVLKQGTILSEVNGLLKHVKKDASLGILPLSQLKSTLEELIPSLAPDMVVKYMTSMLFCSEVNSQALIQLTDFCRGTASSEETYLFFPSLICVEKPTQVWEWSPTHPYVYACGWHLKCTDPDSFFTPRFLQRLQMELAFKFALKVHSSPTGLLEPEKGCRLWLNGIRWIMDGIEVVMHVAIDNCVLGLMLRCIKGREMECVRLRSELIKRVFAIKTPTLKTVETLEYLIHPHFLHDLSVVDAASLPLNEVASAIIQEAGSIFLDDPGLKLAPGYPYLVIQNLLYFEPYEGMGIALLQELFNQENSSKIIKPSTLHQLTRAMHKNWKLVAVALKTPPDVLAAVETKNTSEYDRCLSILKEWVHRERTYSDLRHDLGQYSVFCGRNPLDTSGITLPKIPNATDNQPSDDLNVVHLQGAPKLHQLLCMYPDGDRSQRAVRAIAVVSPKWEVVAFCLEFEEHVIQTIERNNLGDCEGACRNMFGCWLEGNNRRPVTWETLIRALYEADVSLKALADQIKEILHHTPPTCHSEVLADP